MFARTTGTEYFTLLVCVLTQKKMENLKLNTPKQWGIIMKNLKCISSKCKCANDDNWTSGARSLHSGEWQHNEKRVCGSARVTHHQHVSLMQVASKYCIWDSVVSRPYFLISFHRKRDTQVEWQCVAHTERFFDLRFCNADKLQTMWASALFSTFSPFSSVRSFLTDIAHLKYCFANILQLKAGCPVNINYTECSDLWRQPCHERKPHRQTTSPACHPLSFLAWKSTSFFHRKYATV